MKQVVLAVACVFLFENVSVANAKNIQGRTKSMKNEIKPAQEGDRKPTPSPIATKFTSSPLRNRIRLELGAPVSRVWSLVGDFTKFPDYSSGLARVEEKRDASGKLTEYVCHFKPQEGEKAGITSREKIRWLEPNRGYASSGAQPDAFGLENDLNLVILASSQERTILTWDEYYDAKDVSMMKAHFDQALGDIGENLVRRFGGKIVERYVEK